MCYGDLRYLIAYSNYTIFERLRETVAGYFVFALDHLGYQQWAGNALTTYQERAVKVIFSTY